MNCRDVKEKTDEYLLSNLNKSEEDLFEVHCKKCANCSQCLIDLGTVLIESDKTDAKESFETCFSAVQQEIAKSKFDKKWNILYKLPPALQKIVACLIAVGVTFSYYSPAETGTDGLKLSINWKQDGNLLTNHNDRPIIRDGKIFTLRKDQAQNKLVALDKVTGDIAWQQPIGLTTTLVSDDTQIYAGQLHDGKFSISALSVFDGQEKWTYEYTFRSAKKKNFQFHIGDGRLNWIVNRTIHSFDTAKGELLWTRKLNSKKESYALPVYDNGKLFIAGSRNMYTLDVGTGSVLNKLAHEEVYTHYLKPKIATTIDKLFVSANSSKGVGRVICYDKTSGNKLWQKNVEKIQKLQVSHGLLIVKNKKLEAFDQSTGNLVWSDPIGGCYEVAFRKDKIFAINSTKRHDIIALDTKTGNHVKSFTVSGQSCSGISIDGNDGFLTTNAGILYSMSF